MAHPLQLEIGAQQFFVEVVSLLFQLFTVIRKVPALQRQLSSKAFGKPAHVGQVLFGKRQGGVNQLGEELAELLRGLAHAVAEHVLAVVGIAQQFCLLAAQPCHLADYLVIVVLVAAVATAVVGAPHLFAQRAVVGIGDKGAVGGIGQGEHPAVHLALLSLLPCGGHHVLGQAGKILFARDVQNVAVVVGQHILVHSL